jgi:hypothetical protein
MAQEFPLGWHGYPGQHHNNKFRIDGEVGYIEIPSSGGFVEVMVDAEDIPRLIPMARWRYTKVGAKHSYVMGSGRWPQPRRTVYFLHRVVTSAEKGQVVDHIDGDTLDCRKKSLRIVTSKENAANKLVNRIQACSSCSLCSKHKTI